MYNEKTGNNSYTLKNNRRFVAMFNSQRLSSIAETIKIRPYTSKFMNYIRNF